MQFYWQKNLASLRRINKLMFVARTIINPKALSYSLVKIIKASLKIEFYFSRFLITSTSAQYGVTKITITYISTKIDKQNSCLISILKNNYINYSTLNI